MSYIFKKRSIQTILLYLCFVLSSGYLFALEFYYIINSGSPLYNVDYLAVYDSKGNRLDLGHTIKMGSNDIILINRLACTTKPIDVTISKELIGPINSSKTPPMSLEMPLDDTSMVKGCQIMRAFFKVPPDAIPGEYHYSVAIKVSPMPLITIKQPLPAINIDVSSPVPKS